MRHLDEAKSTDTIPVHSFDRVEKLAPGEIACIDIDMFSGSARAFTRASSAARHQRPPSARRRDAGSTTSRPKIMAGTSSTLAGLMPLTFSFR